MRDPDVIMTPFEYDENPWDGWGCPDPTNLSSSIPLDGDPATDENKGEVIAWNAVAANNNKKIIDSPKTPATGGPIVTQVPNLLQQTRGVVWGAERPELLITETLAFHDRRTEDLESASSTGHVELNEAVVGPPRQDRKDDPDGVRDLDQRLRPKGSLFVEVQNPWSAQGQYPTELYSLIDSATGQFADVNGDGVVNSQDMQGVALGRLSNLAVDANGNLTSAPSSGTVKRSPVWRIAVVEEWPDARNDDAADDLPSRTDVALPPGTNEPKPYKDQATAVRNWLPTAAAPIPPFRAADPDFDIGFKTGFVPKQQGSANNFTVDYPYIEREFYFTTDNSPTIGNAPNQTPNFAATSFKLRIPDRSMQIGGPASAVRARAQKFLPPSLENTPGFSLAPILPGRYGVIGTAGATV